MKNQIKPSEHEAILEAASVIEDWVPPEMFCKRFPNIPEKTLNWQLTSRHRNGLGKYVQVIGKKRFISIRGYARWLKENQRKEIGA